MSRTTKVALWATVATAALVALLLPLVFFWGAGIYASVSSTLVAGAVFWLFVATTLGSLLWAWLWLEGSGYRGKSRPVWVPVVLSMLAAVGLLAWVFFIVPTEKMQYADDFTVVVDPTPVFEPRAPFIQAKTLLERNRGGVQSGPTTVEPAFLGNGRWSLIVDGSGTGLKAWGVVEWSGTNETESAFRRCEFASSTSAVGGALWNSLIREVRFAHGLGAYTINRSDIYGFCDATGEAVMVVPVTRATLTLPSRGVFAGVVLVRSDDSMEFLPDVSPGELPGPVYPESLVARVEAANGARDGSIGDIIFIRNNVLVQDGGSDNPNNLNRGQFMLTSEEDGELYAVTPMVRGKGTGNEIVAVAVTPVSYGSAGTVNPVTLHELSSPRQANAEVANLVRSEFSNLNWFAGLEVMEITPTGPELWSGSIGRDVSPEHRFTISSDRTICVTDVATGRSRGCRGTSDRTANLPPATTGTSPAFGDLNSLDAEELIELRDRVIGELDSRLRVTADR